MADPEHDSLFTKEMKVLIILLSFWYLVLLANHSIIFLQYQVILLTLFQAISTDRNVPLGSAQRTQPKVNLAYLHLVHNTVALPKKHSRN